MPRLLFVALVISVACRSVVFAQTPPSSGPIQTAQDLKRLSIEELSLLDVTSVSRRPERVADVAAAVSVIREADLRRSGATSLVEALRLADAVDVAHVNPNTWAVTARGFNAFTANKLLVLVDGRSIYSPLFSGTFWEVQDAVFADLDRIEVVRGPGGATWGANAMNGVINIISKSAAETRGNLAMITAGSDELPVVSARHGGRAGKGGSYRVYGKFRQRDVGVSVATRESAGGDLVIGQAGFRFDTDEARASHWMLEGEVYRGRVGAEPRDDADLAGGNIMARYTRRFSSSSVFTGHVYFDRTWRRIPEQFEELRNTVEADAQHTREFRSRHTVVFGGQFRISHATDEGVAGFLFDPEERTNTLFSLFAQDEFAIRPGHLFLIAGSKFEGNDYTGLEIQPTARLRWLPRNNQTFWAALSRAVRLPTRFDTDLRIVNPITRTVLITGRENFDSESVIAYEAGYRAQPHARVALDLALFANRYDDLRSQELPTAPGEPVILSNLLNAVTSGVEVSATFQAAADLRLHGSYSYLFEDFSTDPGSRDVSGGMFEANDPSHIFKVRSYLDLPHGFELDGFFRAFSSRPAPVVPAYAELDLRLGWRIRPVWELALTGRNLLHDRHAELFYPGSPRYEFERAVHLQSIWRF